ncbi:MAG: TGS domain-containing protein, partial [Alphaproteobacteria bacterium]|nr:TGS domain-containing protein [Alphaproteobacteria bacterium]
MSDIALIMPDGSVRPFARGGTGADLAADISRSLAKRAVAIRVGGTLRDLAEPLMEDSAVEIVTRDDPDGLDLIR